MEIETCLGLSYGSYGGPDLASGPPIDDHGSVGIVGLQKELVVENVVENVVAGSVY